ncbi:hypothetical protein CRUP_013772 [Coryphaenoides rupestris]|nr:hypothetical protein CRUP_013772 [Coryphaenoides rupestris]
MDRRNQPEQTMKGHVGLLLCIAVLSFAAASGQVTYSIPEEMKIGSLVGNVAQDIGLDLKRLASGRARIHSADGKPLDRENSEQMSLLLSAFDGGEPLMSGTMQIHVTVLDANDNSPHFTKPVYEATLTENSPKGTSVMTVSASDKDKGSNGEITYIISNSKHRFSEIFQIDKTSGAVILVGNIDYEKNKHYQVDIEAVDSGGLSDSSKIIVDVIDVNDNRPLINVLSKSDNIVEDSPPDTVIAMLSVSDPDSAENGEVECSMIGSIPFKIQSTLNGFYSLVTDVALDREVASHYNVSVTCCDQGVPSLSSSITLSLQITTVPDKQTSRPTIKHK